MSDTDARRERFMREALALAEQNARAGRGGPFGALVVRGDEVVARGVNQVTASNDPTAHAEIVAIRAACRALGSFQLDGCELYTSCEPCPMCLGAIYWARPAAVYFAATRHDAAAAGFDDAHIYDEINEEPGTRKIPMRALLNDESGGPFAAWNESEGKVEY